MDAVKRYGFNLKPVTLISGSSQGIGHALAEMLLARGERVMLNARSKDKLENVLRDFQSRFSEGQAAGLAGDISDPLFCKDLVAATVREFGQLHVLVNNAGVAGTGRLDASSLASYDRILDINLKGSVYLTHAAVDALKQSHGYILMVGSLAGLHGLPSFSAYSMSKMALTAFAQSIRAELSSSGVNVGIAQVGFTRNDSDKTQINPDGEVEPVPQRPARLQATQTHTARLLLRQIDRRGHTSTHSLLGKLLAAMIRISPRLVGWILKHAPAP